jgi:hypothetical protein
MGWKGGWGGGDSEYGRSDGAGRFQALDPAHQSRVGGAQGGLAVSVCSDIGRRGPGFQPALAPNTGLLSFRTKQQLTLELLARSDVYLSQKASSSRPLRLLQLQSFKSDLRDHRAVV